jgi:hypothetical protein
MKRCSVHPASQLAASVANVGGRLVAYLRCEVPGCTVVRPLKNPFGGRALNRKTNRKNVNKKSTSTRMSQPRLSSDKERGN